MYQKIYFLTLICKDNYGGGQLFIIYLKIELKSKKNLNR